MSTLDTIETAFASYLRDQVPGRVIVRANIGEAAAPATAATLWQLTGVQYSDYPTVSVAEDPLQRVSSTDTMLTFTVTCLGGEAMRDAAALVLGLRMSQRTADLYRVCGLLAVEQVQDLSALETGTIRTRAQFLVVLSAMIDLTGPAEVIDEISVTLHENAHEFDRTIIIEAP